jgi:ATP-dependent exoDNAse (exonuclease V) alpha subunit
MRGPYPGLGSALTAFGIENGSLVAYEIERKLAEKPETIGNDPWPKVDELFKKPSFFSDEIGKKIGKTLQNTWQNLSDERRSLLKLLSRFELSIDQAIRYYVHEDKQRTKFNIQISDSEILANPYRLYEIDSVTPDPIMLSTIDRGVFPDVNIRKKYPLANVSELSDALDPRRVCAFTIRQLELAAVEGHTLKSQETIIQEIRELDVQPACPVTGDHMSGIQAAFEPRIRLVQLSNGSPAYQLNSLFKFGEKIRSTINKRINGVRHSKSIDWSSLLNHAISAPINMADQSEANARKEKVAALEELYASRFSVLIGPAGTGKTTLLKVLCHEPSVERGGILLLAPTGKARVRIETQTEIKGAQTIAQFLLALDRYEGTAAKYRFSESTPPTGNYKTVIIDEASMLTEDQLAAVLDAVKGVERFILVGDPRQLPPIGAGRPFLDIVQKLMPSNAESIFPRIGANYAELTIRRRQIGQARDDLLLAEWFSGREIDPGADEIWEKIQDGISSEHLRFVEWEKPDELQEKLLETISQELKFENKDDSKSFELSIGGSEYNNYVFFWETKQGTRGACYKVEDWQVLSPVRNMPVGVDALNRLIQTTYRSKTKGWATKVFGRKIPKPMGREEILYGDKVIQTRNQRRYKVYPEANALQYVANGEMGIAVGQYKTKNVKFTPFALEVEFSSQPGYKYSYSGKDFGEEANPTLELAYTLTIHKTQGSEFGITFVVIPNPCRLLSRELLYTALTRQRNKIVIFHQGPLNELKNYSEDYYSESATRLTNLFERPTPVMVNGRFLENQLIHRTAKGLCVRSKSEVIIASELDYAGIEYVYDAKFTGQDGSIRYPDFAIDDSDNGKRYYWEHLGMLSKPEYKSRWEKKLLWYEKQGVLPAEVGGGANGILITTADHLDGGIDVEEIKNVVTKYFRAS